MLLRNNKDLSAALPIAAVMFMLGTSSVDGAVVRYRAVLLEPLNDGPIAHALAINSVGAVTGTAGSGTVNPGQHVVLWEDQNVQNLDPMFTLSEGQVISDSGTIAGMGNFCPPVNGACTGVLARALPGGQFMPIGTLGGGNGQVLDINAAGAFVGWAYDEATVQRAFVYTEADGLQDLSRADGFAGNGTANAISDDGTVVGFNRDLAFNQRAFAWSNGVLTDLGTFGGASSEATDISNAGTIVGWAKAADGMPHAFRTDANGGLVNIESLPQAMWSAAHLISDTGLIAGTFYDGEDDRLFAYTKQSGMVEIVPPVRDFHAMAPRDLNSQGQMVGVGITNMYVPLAWFWSEATGIQALDEVLVAGPAINITGVGGINDGGQIAVTATLAGTFTQRAARLDPIAPADINADGTVDVDDLLAVIGAWGSDDPIADIDGDGVVEVDDLLEVITNWG